MVGNRAKGWRKHSAEEFSQITSYSLLWCVQTIVINRGQSLEALLGEVFIAGRIFESCIGRSSWFNKVSAAAPLRASTGVSNTGNKNVFRSPLPGRMYTSSHQYLQSVNILNCMCERSICGRWCAGYYIAGLWPLWRLLLKASDVIFATRLYAVSKGFDQT